MALPILQKSCCSTIHEHNSQLQSTKVASIAIGKKASTRPIVNKSQSLTHWPYAVHSRTGTLEDPSPYSIPCLQHITKSIVLVQAGWSAKALPATARSTSTSLTFIPAADGTVLPKQYLLDQGMTHQRAAQEVCSQQRAAKLGTPASSYLQTRFERKVERARSQGALPGGLYTSRNASSSGGIIPGARITPKVPLIVVNAPQVDASQASCGDGDAVDANP